VVALNATLGEVADELGVTVVDIGPINRLVVVDPAMLMQRTPPVPDPSAKQYAGWAELIGLYVQDALAFPQP
jgi:hypothetical protein